MQEKPLKFKALQWSYLGAGNYHRVHVSTCRNWVRKSPLTSCGIIWITFAPNQTQVLKSCLKGFEFDAVFIVYADYVYYWSLELPIENIIQMHAPSYFNLQQLFEHDEAGTNIPRKLSCFELNTLSPYLQPVINLKKLFSVADGTCARNVRKWRKINPHIPAYDLGDIWITRYCGNRLASDNATAKLVKDIFNTTGELLLDACIDDNVLMHNSNALAVDFDLAVCRGSVESEQILQINVPTKEFSDLFDFYAAPGKKPLTVSTIRTLLYLINQLPGDANKYLITENLSAIPAIKKSLVK